MSLLWKVVHLFGSIGMVAMAFRYLAPLWETDPLACVGLCAAVGYTALSMFGRAMEWEE